MGPDMHFDIEQHKNRVGDIRFYFVLLRANMGYDSSSDEYESLDSLQYLLWLRTDGFLYAEISTTYRSLFHGIDD